MVLVGKQPLMIIIYSCFLIDVQTGHQSGYSKLQEVKKYKPNIFEMYAVYARDQQHSEKSEDGDTEMANFVELQKNYT